MSEPVSPNDGSGKSPSVQPGKRIRGRISIDLQGSYGSWISWCRSTGLLPSDALRGLVARLRPGEWPNEPAVSGVGTRESVGARALIVERPKVPLNDQEARAVAELAELEGMTVPRWIVGEVKRRLDQCGASVRGNPGNLDGARLQKTSEAMIVGTKLQENETYGRIP